MAAKVRIVMNSPGVRELLQSAEIQRDLRRRVDAIAAAAGEGYEASHSVGASRARASVITATPEAMADNATNNTLTKALDAGRQ